MKLDANVLIINEPNSAHTAELIAFLHEHGCHVCKEMKPGPAIEKAQNIPFDVIILDAGIKEIEITGIIRILKELNPQSRIIVNTHSNSKSQEVKIRGEKIFYYHIESFGTNELKLAVQSALERKKP
ncbi:hypothetical protein JXJ21_18580 [candidate division KSB1 bacterium]|nr:hypothetical protein [candidate division KSB1 bacterium]